MTLPRTQTLRKGILLDRDGFFNRSDNELIDLFGKAFDPELRRLKNASPTAESSPVDETAGKETDDYVSPSHRLYKKDYVEINRTLNGMLALKWLMTEDYEAFTCQQPCAIKLKPQSFQELRALFKDGLKDPETLYALLVATVVNDLGKDPNLSKEITAEGHGDLLHQNHDMVVYVAAEANMIDLLSDFDIEMRSDLMLGLKFGSSLNGAQLAQAENVPGSLEGARAMKNHERAFTIKYMELLLDVAGADGHVEARGAKAMNEPVFQAFKATRQVLLDIASGECDLRTGYDQVLSQRQEMLAKVGFRQLSVTIESERALLRMLAMSRAATKEEAERVYQAFQKLSPNNFNDLVNGLAVDGWNDGVAVLPYYIPAIFAESIRTTNGMSEEIQVAALSSVMRLLSRVYHGTKPKPGQPGRVVECDLSYLQDIVKGVQFRNDPTILDIETPELKLDVSPKACTV